MTMPSEGIIHGNVENRKASKPLIEKRRRARINHSLAELKTLVIDSKKDAQSQNARPPKLEKADILEMTVSHLRDLHKYLETKSPMEDVDGSFKAGFSKCLEEIYSFVEREPTLTITQKNKLLTHLTNITTIFPLNNEHVASAMDDTTSSYSGNSSRSNTPSSAVNESTSMEYLPCSPYSDTNQEGSSNSSSPPFTTRTILSKNISSFQSNSQIGGNRSSSRLPSPSAEVSRVGIMEADSTSHNINRPLNLASNSRTFEELVPHGQYDNSSENRLLLNNQYARSINGIREVAVSNNGAPNRFVLRNDLDESAMMHMEPVWRPW